MLQYRGNRDSYYCDATRFITDNSEVDHHLEQLGYADDNVI